MQLMDILLKQSKHKLVIGALSIITVTMIALVALKYCNRSGSPQAQVETKRSRAAKRGSDLPASGKLSNPGEAFANPLSMEDVPKLAGAVMTPELARKLLERTKVEIKGIQDRARISSSIMMALCKQGYSAEAWELIDSNPGDLRELEIGTIFQYSLEPLNTLASKLETLVEPMERMQALRALVDQRPTEIINFDFSKISIMSPQDKIAIASGIMAAMKESGSTPGSIDTSEALLGKVVNLVNEHKLDASNLSTILNNDFSIDAFRRWEILDGLKDGIEKSEVERIYADVVPNMIRSDVDKTMDLISSNPSSKYSVPIISRAITTMYEADPQYANSWVTTHLPTLDPATGQRVVVRVAQVAIKNGEFETARQWANHLLNAGVKQQVLDQIEAAQTPKPTGGN